MLVHLVVASVCGRLARPRMHILSLSRTCTHLSRKAPEEKLPLVFSCYRSKGCTDKWTNLAANGTLQAGGGRGRGLSQRAPSITFLSFFSPVSPPGPIA